MPADSTSDTTRVDLVRSADGTTARNRLASDAAQTASLSIVAPKVRPPHVEGSVIAWAGRREVNIGKGCYARRVRYVLALIAVTALLVAGLKLFEWAKPVPPPVELLGIAAPPRLAPGERAAVFGGLRVPAGTYEIGLWTCSHGTCKRTSWIRLEGPETVWRSLGREDAPNGQGRVVLRVYALSQPFGALAGEWSQRVSVE